MSLALAIALIIFGSYRVPQSPNHHGRNRPRPRRRDEDRAQILDRIAGDIVASLGGTDPKQLPEITTDATGAAVAPATSSSGTGTASTGTTATSGATTDASTTQTTPFLSPFNTYVEGSSSLLILSASRVPRELLAPDKRYLDVTDKVCDLRRISYWYVEDGTNGGLARQELTGITTADFGVKPPDVGEIDKLIISGHTAAVRDPCEVVGIMFEFFDGVSWQTEWNGADLAADGMTPIGPPSAIRVTLSIRSRDGLRTKDYRRTVAIPAGNNFMTQQNGL